MKIICISCFQHYCNCIHVHTELKAAQHRSTVLLQSQQLLANDYVIIVHLRSQQQHLLSLHIKHLNNDGLRLTSWISLAVLHSESLEQVDETLNSKTLHFFTFTDSSANNTEAGTAQTQAHPARFALS